jgi:hypothetical protein
VGTPTTTSYTNTGLTANTTYYYQVTAKNANGESTRSTTVSATTNSSGGGTGLPAGYHGAWVNTESGELYTLTLSATTANLAGERASHAALNARFTAAANANSTYTQYPNGYTVAVDTYGYDYFDPFGFIALSTDGKTVLFMQENKAGGDGFIFTKLGPNPLFTGNWKPLDENDEETAGLYIFSNDGTFEMSAAGGASIVKGTHTATGTTSGYYTLATTHINGAAVKEMYGDTENLFTPKLQDKWYTAEEYATLVVDHIGGLEALMEAEKAERYAEIDADNTLTPEEKASAKEGVDMELGLRYGFVEALLPMITLLLFSEVPEVNEEDPYLNGTATYALTNSNNTLTFTVVTRSQPVKNGPIVPETKTTTYRRVN